MSKIRLPLLVGFCAALIPTLVAAGDTSACLVIRSVDAPQSFLSLPEGKFGGFSYCADDLTEGECSEFSGDGATWLEGRTCLSLGDLPFQEWDGVCRVQFDPFDGVCVLVWTDPQETFTSQDVCEGKGAGIWSDDPAVCPGVPVPAAPRAALALMVLVLLSGSLAVLAFKGSGA